MAAHKGRPEGPPFCKYKDKPSGKYHRPEGSRKAALTARRVALKSLSSGGGPEGLLFAAIVPVETVELDLARLPEHDGKHIDRNRVVCSVANAMP